MHIDEGQGPARSEILKLTRGLRALMRRVLVTLPQTVIEMRPAIKGVTGGDFKSAKVQFRDGIIKAEKSTIFVAGMTITHSPLRGRAFMDYDEEEWTFDFGDSDNLHVLWDGPWTMCFNGPEARSPFVDLHKNYVGISDRDVEYLKDRLRMASLALSFKPCSSSLSPRVITLQKLQNKVVLLVEDNLGLHDKLQPLLDPSWRLFAGHAVAVSAEYGRYPASADYMAAVYQGIRVTAIRVETQDESAGDRRCLTCMQRANVTLPDGTAMGLLREEKERGTIHIWLNDVHIVCQNGAFYTDQKNIIAVDIVKKLEQVSNSLVSWFEVNDAVLARQARKPEDCSF